MTPLTKEQIQKLEELAKLVLPHEWAPLAAPCLIEERNFRQEATATVILSLIEQLKKAENDSQRIDWLGKNYRKIGNMSDDHWFTTDQIKRTTLRETVDAAIEIQKTMQ